MLGGLDSPTSGKILVEGNDIANLNNDELADYRALTVGFVFQSYNLIPTLTVFENVALVKEICKNHLPVKEMLNEVGLIDYIDKFPSELSGGELQRLSIARAILKDSKIVILDEATANVDPENEEKLMKAIDSLTLNKTVIMIAHRLKTVRNCDNIFVINEGKIVESGRHEDLIKQDGIYKRFVLDRKEAVGWKI